MNAEEVRRHYLLHGGSPVDTAETLGVSRSAIYQALATANRRTPLTVPTLTLDVAGMPKPDQEAIAAFVRGQLTRAGILKEPPAEPTP